MDCSKLVLNVIKDDTIKKNLNPLVYYSIKMIYDPEFSKRSRYFCRALKLFFTSFSKDIGLSKVTSGLSHSQKKDNTYILKMIIEQSLNQNKEDNSIDNIFNHEWSWYVDKLLSYDPVYILDKEDDYCLLYMLQDYVFETQDPKTSELMQGYNLFVSSVELMFCLRLILHFPNLAYMKKESTLSAPYFETLKDRVKKFCYI